MAYGHNRFLTLTNQEGGIYARIIQNEDVQSI